MRNYVRRVGKNIHDIHDKPFTLKGVGIGGWLLIEGYMIQSFDTLDRPRRIKEYLIKHIGEEQTEWFFQQWVKEFFTKEDITLIKKQGFNSIRIPIDYEFLFEPSEITEELKPKELNFQLLDSMIEACKKNELYVVLDLHAAPGGQTGTNIDNSKNDHPDLFTSGIYQLQTCYIWKVLASRYKDEPYIAAYDLLNEPLPNWQSKYNHLLLPLYKKIIKEIREVDKHHLITVEGFHWTTDLSCFTELLDENIMLQFHKYWSSPDIESIQDYLDLRDRLDVPLYMGEGGENNKLWYSTVFKLYDQMNISYAFWTYKKMSNSNSIVSFKKPNNWDVLLKDEVASDDVKSILEELISNITYKNCQVHPDVSNHILNKEPFELYSYGYDFFGEDISYYRNKKNPSSLRVNDGLLIANSSSEIVTPNFKHYNGEEVGEEDFLSLHLKKDEWVKYTIKSQEPMIRFSIDCSTPDGITVFVNDKTTRPSNNQFLYKKDNGSYKIKVLAKEDVIIHKIIVF